MPGGALGAEPCASLRFPKMFDLRREQSFMGFPPRQGPAAFDVDTVPARVMDAGAGSS
jgi:hypothetical protein